jgi:TonB family protein
MFILFLAAAAAAASLPKATAIDVASWFSADDYPADAARKGLEGNVAFEVDVDANGKPTACRIRESSGSASLDQKTCEIVLARAQFKPAMRHGKPVPGRYSNKTNWRLEGAATSIPTGSGYIATILDFSKDSEHPTCTVVNGGLQAGPTCPQALQEFAGENAGAKLTKAVFLLSLTNGTEQPYRGDPAWGPRVGFLAIDLFQPKSGGKAACVVVADEGGKPGSDPCGQYADATKLTEKDKRDATKAHFEQSVFGILRRATSQGKCKDGESNGEAQGCV